MQSITRSLKSLTLTSRRRLATSATSTATESAPAASWTPSTQRTGVVARKLGMTALWQDGIRVPVTVLHLDDVQVLSSSVHPATDKEEGRRSVVLGCSSRKAKNTNQALLGQFRKAGVEPKLKVAEFVVSEDAVVPPGTAISAAHFVPGQHVDVQAASIGKGFQGVMKRHNFAGLRASHGTSVSHRSHGSTGQHQDPGRVWPGKKMAGRMGGKLVTTQNLLVHRIDNLRNVIYVKGAVPGAPGSFVRVTDALKKVGWKAGARARRGLGLETGEVLAGISGFPMPVGTAELAKTLPREVEAGRVEVTKPTK